jgi:hypothetical protein
MAQLEGIVVPDGYPQLSTATVLTSAWVPGARWPSAGWGCVLVQHLLCSLRAVRYLMLTCLSDDKPPQLLLAAQAGSRSSASDMCELLSVYLAHLLKRLHCSACTLTASLAGYVRAGEKLSESNASDVRELCTTLLNAYLIQLLETGFLHADPHPGNLIRTPEGKIAILDYGLMTEVCMLGVMGCSVWQP